MMHDETRANAHAPLTDSAASGSTDTADTFARATHSLVREVVRRQLNPAHL